MFATSGMKNTHSSKVWTDDHPPVENNIAVMVQLVLFVVRWEVSFSQDCSSTLAIAQNVQIVVRLMFCVGVDYNVQDSSYLILVQGTMNF